MIIIIRADQDRSFGFAQDRRPKTGDRNTVIARVHRTRGILLLISIISWGIKIPAWGWSFDFAQDRCHMSTFVDTFLINNII